MAVKKDTKGKLPKVYPSRGETRYFARRREGMTQQEVAEANQMPVKAYRLLEKDKGGTPREERLAGGLRRNERLTLFRKRANLSQQAVADALGVTKVWVGRMEAGDVDNTPLENYWVGHFQGVTHG